MRTPSSAHWKDKGKSIVLIIQQTENWKPEIFAWIADQMVGLYQTQKKSMCKDTCSRSIWRKKSFVFPSHPFPSLPEYSWIRASSGLDNLQLNYPDESHGETDSFHVQREHSTVALQSLRTFSIKTIKLLQLMPRVKTFKQWIQLFFIFHLSCKLKIPTLNQSLQNKQNV